MTGGIMQYSTKQRQGLVGWLLGTMLVACVPAMVVACSAQPDGQEEASSSGTVSMALSTVTNGTQYRLHGATFTIAGPTATQLVTSDDPAQSVLTATLDVGSYTATLQSGWVLERSDGTSFVPVDATVVSANPATFQITDGGTTNLTYQFNTNGTIITIGTGTLNLSISVTETAAICTVLGAGCSAGNWCAPASIAGGTNVCVGAGPLAVGEACDATVGCVANALCGDIGAGTVCLMLCSHDQIGAACAGAGTCTEVGYPDFGLCL
jgi:hypothetical protein